jgi:hypothetical protein
VPGDEPSSLFFFAQRKFSILLDTRTLEEQYQVEVSLFEARLPLLSPFAVSIKDKLRIERQGRTYRFVFILSRGALPPVRRTGLYTQDASGFKSDHSSPTRYVRGGITCF